MKEATAAFEHAIKLNERYGVLAHRRYRCEPLRALKAEQVVHITREIKAFLRHLRLFRCHFGSAFVRLARSLYSFSVIVCLLFRRKALPCCPLSRGNVAFFVDYTAPFLLKCLSLHTRPLHSVLLPSSCAAARL